VEKRKTLVQNRCKDQSESPLEKEKRVREEVNNCNEPKKMENEK